MRIDGGAPERMYEQINERTRRECVVVRAIRDKQQCTKRATMQQSALRMCGARRERGVAAKVMPGAPVIRYRDSSRNLSQCGIVRTLPSPNRLLTY